MTQKAEKKPRFPLFVDLSDARVVVIGGGNVAARRIAVLTQFCENVTVVSPQLCASLQTSGVAVIRRAYRHGDCAGASMVVAATDSRAVNHAVFQEASKRGIPINVCDAPEECSFFFPAIIRAHPLIIGMVSDGEHHTLVKETARSLRAHLDTLLPEEEQKNAAT